MKTKLENTVFSNIAEMEQLKNKISNLKKAKSVIKEVAVSIEVKEDRHAAKSRKRQIRIKDKEDKKIYDSAVKKCRDQGKKLRSSNHMMIKVLTDIKSLGLE